MRAGHHAPTSVAACGMWDPSAKVCRTRLSTGPFPLNTRRRTYCAGAENRDAQVVLCCRAAETGGKYVGGDGSAVRLQDELQRAGFVVAISKPSAEADAAWANKMRESIGACSLFVAVCSEGFGKSSVCTKELEIALAAGKAIGEALGRAGRSGGA